MKSSFGSKQNVAGKPLVWAVDHGHPDITRLMRKTIAERLAQAFAGDAEFVMACGLRSDGVRRHMLA